MPDSGYVQFVNSKQDVVYQLPLSAIEFRTVGRIRDGHLFKVQILFFDTTAANDIAKLDMHRGHLEFYMNGQLRHIGTFSYYSSTIPFRSVTEKDGHLWFHLVDNQMALSCDGCDELFSAVEK